MASKRVSTASFRAAATGIGAAVVLHGALLSCAHFFPATAYADHNETAGGGTLEIETRRARLKTPFRARLVRSRTRSALEARLKSATRRPIVERNSPHSTRLRVAPRFAFNIKTTRISSRQPNPQSEIQKEKRRQAPSRIGSKTPRRLAPSSSSSPLHPMRADDSHSASSRAAATRSGKTTVAVAPGRTRRFAMLNASRRAGLNEKADLFRRVFKHSDGPKEAADSAPRTDELAGETNFAPRAGRRQGAAAHSRFALRPESRSAENADEASDDTAPEISMPGDNSRAVQRRSPDAGSAAFRRVLRQERRLLLGGRSKWTRANERVSSGASFPDEAAGSQAANANKVDANDNNSGDIYAPRRSYGHGRASNDSFSDSGDLNRHNASASENNVSSDASDNTRTVGAPAPQSGSANESRQRGAPQSTASQSTEGAASFDAAQASVASRDAFRNVSRTDASVGGAHAGSRQLESSHRAGSDEIGGQSREEPSPGKGKRDEQTKNESTDDAQSRDEATRASARDEAISQSALPLVRARLLSRPSPDYPEEAKRLGQEGVVRLRLKISATGEVKSVVVVRSSGYQLLDEAALRAARDCRASPARRGANAIESSISIPIRFRLN